MALPNVLLVCEEMIAIPVMQQLAFFKQLAALVIPEESEHLINISVANLSSAGVPVVIVSKTNFADKIAEAIKDHAIEIGLIFSFRYKIPGSVYQMPAKGFFNLHPGILPAYRGPDPIFQHIRNREKFAGVTLHKIDDKFNHGPIVMIQKLILDTSFTYDLLSEKLSLLATKLTGTLLKLISFDLEIPLKVQNESEANYFHKQSQKDTTINWLEMDAATILALINACIPWNQGAITFFNEKTIRVLNGELADQPISFQPPGTILGIYEQGLIISAVNNESVYIKTMFAGQEIITSGNIEKFGMKTGSRFN